MTVPADNTAGLAGDERGMLSLASLFAVLGLVIGFALLANIGKTVGTKLETQNAADAVAYSAGVELARGMNTVTAANHTIGELQALVVIHRALGGDELESGEGVDDPIWLTLTLTYNYSWALPAGPNNGTFEKVSARHSESGAAVYDSRRVLKDRLNLVYLAMRIGWMMRYFPPTAAAGQLVITAAKAIEFKIRQEWETLELIEKLATPLRGPLKTVRTLLMPRLRDVGYGMAGVPMPGSGEISLGASAVAADLAANDMARRYGADADLYPGTTTISPLGLPVAPEPTDLSRMERSQLVRASTPWVQHWRAPWFDFGRYVLFLANFNGHYEKWTNHYTIELARRAKTDQGMNLLVLRDLNVDADDKTHEPWTYAAGSGRADELFCVVGLARRPAPGIAAYGRFRQPNPDGFVTFAQAMIYNANPQRRGNVGPGQPVAGWDTLNWADRVPEYPGQLSHSDQVQPRVRLNWRAKLVPTTRLAEASDGVAGPAGDVLRRAGARDLVALPNAH